MVHAPGADPNFLLIGPRSQSELESNAKGIQGTFCSNRNSALLKYQKENQELSSESLKNGTSNPRSVSTFENLSKWYSSKIQELQPLTLVYSNPTSPETLEISKGLIEKTQNHWKSVLETLISIKESIVGPFALGDQVSLADVHLMVWFARLLAVCQGLKENQADKKVEFDALENSLKNECLKGILGGEKELDLIDRVFDGKLLNYWRGLKERESFKVVYKDGIH